MKTLTLSIVVAAFIMMISQTALPVTVLPGQGVEFFQVDFVNETGTYPDSRTGRIIVDIATLQSSTMLSSGYINAVTALGWVVQNLPVVSGPYYSYISTHFCLALASGPESTLTALVDFSLEPVAYFSGTPSTVFSVESTVTSIGGYGGPPPAGEPAPPDTAPFPFVPGGATWLCCQPGHVVVETAWNQCAPEAVASSFDYLRTAFGVPIPDPHVMGKGRTVPPTLVGELDHCMGRTALPPNPNRRVGPGVWGNQVLEGKLEYLAACGICDLILRHQCARMFDLSVPAGDFRAHGLTSWRVGGLPTFAWILDQICAGEDVEIGFEQPAHFAEVVCAGWILGVPTIIHASDQDQTNDALGTAGVQIDFVWDADGDGRPNLMWHYAGANIEIVISQSPGGASRTEGTTWGAIKAMYR